MYHTITHVTINTKKVSALTSTNIFPKYNQQDVIFSIYLFL